MKLRHRDNLLIRLFAVPVAYLAFAPLFLLPAAALVPNHPLILYGLPILPIVLAWAISFLPGRYRKWGILAAVLAHAAIGVCVLFPISPWAPVLLVPCLFVLFMFVRALVSAPNIVWMPNDLVVGAGLHIAGQIILRFLPLPDIKASLSVFFSCYLISCLFLVNRHALLNTVGEKTALPQPLLAKNRRALIFIAIPALVIGNLDAFKRLMLAALEGIKAAIAWLMMFFANLFPMSETSGGQMAMGPQDMLGMAEEAEKSAFWQLMEKIVIVIAYAVLAALLLFFAYVLFKRLKKWFAALVARFKAYSRAIGQDYVEQSESLLNLDKAVENIRAKVRSALKRRSRPPDWQKLSPRDTVRAAYRIWLKKEGDIAPSMTAAEALTASGKDAALAAVYDRARYSDRPVSKEEAEEARREMAL